MINLEWAWQKATEIVTNHATACEKKIEFRDILREFFKYTRP